jgi:two-component system sensor histidine kinase HupT/HoxJ
MVSSTSTVIFTLLLGIIACFFVWSIQKRQRLHLLHKVYLFLTGFYGIWIIALIIMHFVTTDGSVSVLETLDALTQSAKFCTVFYLYIALVFVKGYEKLPRWCYLLLIMPALDMILCLTNSLHHLEYIQFSVVKSEIVFGPVVYISGIYNYICLFTSMMLPLAFARKNPSTLYRKQCALLASGGLCPLVVSVIATLTNVGLPISATALSFIPVILFNGFAIYQLHLLDIKPVATQHVLDWISDCYLILSEQGLVISYNRPFASVFASRYGITENRYLRDCIKEDDISKKTAIYNMITAVDACQESQSTISYEQSANTVKDGVTVKSYYMAEVSPLVINEKSAGYVLILKDITQMKKSMQLLQDNEKHMMEQERLAFLGQMMGGLAHNLKTPIMSISGCVSAADSLIDECLSSLGDPVVTDDDYREIYGEMRGWFDKIRDSSAYMSDIITTIKGQASNVSTFENSIFTQDELIKRTTLLMRHELQSAGCTLVSECNTTRKDITLHGDINNLVQVLGNLVSNAIYAQKAVGGPILIGMSEEDEQLKIYVKDHGTGIPEKVRSQLFRSMITSKGTQGTGLGLYISNAVVRGKFNGYMWAEDNPDGGAIIGMTIPLRTPEAATVDGKKGVMIDAAT